MKNVDIQALAKSLNKTDKQFIEMIRVSPPSPKNFKADIPENRLYNKTIRLMMRYVQRQRIKKELNLDMDKVIKTDDRFGPLDWRTHEAQIM